MLDCRIPEQLSILNAQLFIVIFIIIINRLLSPFETCLLAVDKNHCILFGLRSKLSEALSANLNEIIDK